MLRHRDGRIDTVTKERYQIPGRSGPKLSFPTAIEEASDAGAADAVYISATRWLLSQTRDTKTFSLLFQQNINYGYRRNVLGLRPWGMGITTAALVITLGVAAFHAARNQDIDTTLVAAFLVAAAALVFWIVAVLPSWVKTATIFMRSNCSQPVTGSRQNRQEGTYQRPVLKHRDERHDPANLRC